LSFQSNRQLLAAMAARLKPLLPEIVFVGGCTTGLLITDPAASSVRATDDVDVIVEVASYAEYADETILGFSNRWYKPAIDAAAIVALDGFELRVVTTPYFIGTKLEAFRGRGKGDLYASSDLEDIITVLDGRPRLSRMSRIPLANSAATSAEKSASCSITRSS
jgi:hypothetical protein